MDVCVKNSAAFPLVEFDDYLPLSVSVDVAVSVEAYVIVDGCYHNDFFDARLRDDWLNCGSKLEKYG